MGRPARLALPRQSTVETFAMLVSAVEASVGCLDTTDIAVLFIKMLTYDRLAIDVENLAFELLGLGHQSHYRSFYMYSTFAHIFVYVLRLHITPNKNHKLHSFCL